MKEDLCFFLPPAESIPFYAELAGISYCDGTYFQQRRDSPICVLEYVVEGTGTLIINGQKLSASAGDVYILPLGSNHTYYSDEKHPWTKIFLNAGGELAPFLLRAYHLDTQFVFPQCPVEPLFRELLNIANGPALQEARNARMALQLHKIVQGIYQHAKRTGRRNLLALDKILRDILGNFARDQRHTSHIRLFHAKIANHGQHTVCADCRAHIELAAVFFQ